MIDFPPDNEYLCHRVNLRLVCIHITKRHVAMLNQLSAKSKPCAETCRLINKTVAGLATDIKSRWRLRWSTLT